MPDSITMWSSCPRFHARVEHRDEANFPVVSILIGEGQPWIRWVDYRKRFQIAGQRSVARHIGLFIDFLGARGHEFQALDCRGRLMQTFADALAMGTIDGRDASRLWWLPLSIREARRALSDVTTFGDWLEEKGYAATLNPTRTATLEEQIIFWRRWSHVKANALLGHLKSRARDSRQALVARDAVVRKQAFSSHQVPKAFPKEAIVPLLQDGFTGRSRELRWTTLRDQLILMIMHFGGKRLSEVLQMWTGDVEANPKDRTRCIPWISHPTDGFADWVDPMTGNRTRVTRQLYLKLQYNRLPLTLETGRRRVGWKNPMLSGDNRMRVFWNDTSADRLFWTLYRQYVQMRPLISRHPFLFMTPAGDPMTVQAYEKNHAAGVRRIGLIPEKRAGTTPHGHRHAYGHEAEARGVGRKSVQVAMGHASPASQDTYKNRADDAIANELIAATERLDRTLLEDLSRE